MRWAVPGDHAVADADGLITLLGRGSVSINSGGEKIYPEEVESVLKGHAEVIDAVVVGVPDERWGERVVAVVQPRAGTHPCAGVAPGPRAASTSPATRCRATRVRRRDHPVAVGQARLPLGQGDRARRARGRQRQMTNRLGAETSPYLRQHRDNPVDWYPWGDEAFARAAAEGKPIFLSVGYSSCHWCHVMAHESFETPATAELMNQLFVNVKVDREERPDVDAVYMQAVQALTGRGGWPMSVWLTPDGRPFYGGTYFPDEDRHGMPSFTACARSWRKRGASNATTSRNRRRSSQARSTSRFFSPHAAARSPQRSSAAATQNVQQQFDPQWGGFGRAPKFPQAMTIDFLAASSSAPASPPPAR